MRLPRGWWRPLVVYGALGVAVLALEGARDPGTILVVLLAVAPLVAVVILRNTLPPARFLRGLRAAGAAVEVVDDEMTWLGERRMRARTSEGEWRIECWAGSSIHLRVRGPAMRRIREVRGSALQAGRLAREGAVPTAMLSSPFG